MTDAAATPMPEAPLLDAASSDPERLGWMRGSPVPAHLQVRFDDGGMYSFPKLRWAFSNVRQLVPTTQVARGHRAVYALARDDRDDLDAVPFQPLGGSVAMTWLDSLAANYTDGIVVLHHGRIVYERYFGALQANRAHLAWSVTKSFFGTIAASFVEQRRLDPNSPVRDLVPELAHSGVGNATLRQVMDMTTALAYSEDYTDPQAGIWMHARAGGILPRPTDYAGPDSFYEFLVGLRQAGPHGEAFAYKTVNTDVLGWILSRASGRTLSDLLSEQLWFQLGAEQDASLMVDRTGTEFAGGGLSCCLRDLARFGQMLLQEGMLNGRRVIASSVVEDIRTGADPRRFAPAGYVTLPGWSYRNMWWVSHNPHGAYCARGIHGQGVYVDPKAQMVIARFASHPKAGNMNLDPTTLPAYAALARHLINSGP